MRKTRLESASVNFGPLGNCEAIQFGEQSDFDDNSWNESCELDSLHNKSLTIFFIFGGDIMSVILNFHFVCYSEATTPIQRFQFNLINLLLKWDFFSDIIGEFSSSPRVFPVCCENFPVCCQFFSSRVKSERSLKWTVLSQSRRSWPKVNGHVYESRRSKKYQTGRSRRMKMNGSKN